MRYLVKNELGRKLLQVGQANETTMVDGTLDEINHNSLWLLWLGDSGKFKVVTGVPRTRVIEIDHELQDVRVIPCETARYRNAREKEIAFLYFDGFGIDSFFANLVTLKSGNSCPSEAWMSVTEIPFRESMMTSDDCVLRVQPRV